MHDWTQCLANDARLHYDVTGRLNAATYSAWRGPCLRAALHPPDAVYERRVSPSTITHSIATTLAATVCSASEVLLDPRSPDGPESAGWPTYPAHGTYEEELHVAEGGQG